MEIFSGSKIALINGNKVVAIHRDDKPGIRWPNMWELPGGGREGNETPEECAIREIDEELCLKLSSDAFVWKREWPAMHDSLQRAWFLVAEIDADMIARIVLGDEGREWRMMAIDEFLGRDDVVPLLKPRLRDYLGR